VLRRQSYPITPTNLQSVKTFHNVYIFQNESSTASDLKTMLIALKFPKPPANITPALLFGKVEQKVMYASLFSYVNTFYRPIFFYNIGFSWT
jgi:hypothetical protein